MRRWIYQTMSDEALMAAYCRGQPLAFECLYNRHKQKLFNFLNRQCHNRAISEELTHDTWIAVIQNTSSYQAKAKFTTWVFSIAHNRLVDYWRKHGATNRPLVEQLKEQHAVTEDRLSESIELEELMAKLQMLPTEQIETLLLKIEGFTYMEIASITKAKQETVKSRLRYANNSLRLSMEVKV